MTKEEIHDEQIYPLIQKILEICKAHKISFIADFGLDDDLHCTSALLEKEYDPSESQLKALDWLKPRRHAAIAEVREQMADGSQRITLTTIS